MTFEADRAFGICSMTFLAHRTLRVCSMTFLADRASGTGSTTFLADRAFGICSVTFLADRVLGKIVVAWSLAIENQSIRTIQNVPCFYCVGKTAYDDVLRKHVVRVLRAQDEAQTSRSRLSLASLNLRACRWLLCIVLRCKSML